jgi:hypothetical protein
MADLHFFKKNEKNVKDLRFSREFGLHGTRDGDATTSPGGIAVGVLVYRRIGEAVLRAVVSFGPPTPRTLLRACGFQH